MKLAFNNKSAIIVAAPGNETNGFMSRLRTQGLALEHLSSGFQAISHIETRVKNDTLKCDVIILFEDCNDMPLREALNLTRVLVDAKKVPIIVFSKNSDFEDIQELIGEGANDFLTNYSNFNLVIEKLSKVLN